MNANLLSIQVTLKGFLEKEQEARNSAQKEIMDLRSDMLKVRRSASVMGDRESTAEIARLRQVGFFLFKADVEKYDC